jgi:hypothetical protein
VRLILLSLCSIVALPAQTPSATLLGRIEDSTGAALQGTRITLRHLGTNATREAAADELGDYTVAGLAPGSYELLAEAPGFKKLREASVELLVDQTFRLDLKMTVGDVTESVEVTAEAPLLNTENTTRGEVIASTEISEMPLEGRDFNDLSFLVPGVSRRAQGGQGSSLSVNGARADNTNFFIDGFNNQNARGGGANARPPIDAMQEFKMQVTGYPAEYGRLAGGALNMVLKTGTNKLHGTLFEFLRNDLMDARNFFDAQKSKLRRNQFGGMVNGPVNIPRLYKGRNRTFFLASWESYRQVMGATRLARVPTLLERAGNFSRTLDPATGSIVALRDPMAANVPFAGHILPVSRFDPIAARIAEFYPSPNRDGVNNFLVNRNDTDTWNSFLFKFDHRLSQKDSVSVRYLVRLNDLTNPFNGGDHGAFGNTAKERFSLGGITYMRQFTPTLINEARLGYTSAITRQDSVQFGEDWNARLGLPSPASPLAYGFPRVTVRDLVTLGNDAAQPVRFRVMTPEFGNTLTWVRGQHIFKTGGTIHWGRFNQTAINNMRGLYNFLGRWTNDPYGDFLLGLLNNSTRRLDGPTSKLRMTNYGFFVQDDWRVHRNLTLNIGLRWEILFPMHEIDGKLSNFVPELGKIVIASERAIPGMADRLALAGLTGKVDFARHVGLPDSLVYGQYRNFAPRFGFAWRVPKGVIRSGYGIFYGGSLQNPIRQDLAEAFPFALNQTFNRLTADPNVVTLRDPFPVQRLALDGATNAAGYEVRAPAQYMQSWNFTIEREIGKDSAIEIAYVGSKGTHLGRRYDVNQPLRDPNARVNGAFPRPYAGLNTINFYTFGSNSSYNAGILTIRRRIASGAFVRVNYVYSKSIDDASQISGNSAGGYPAAQDARNVRLERGRSDFDNRHTFTMNFNYELPFRQNEWTRGWQVSGTGRIYSGQPFTPRVSNVQLDQGEANRPDRIAKGVLDNPTPDLWFDLRAFPVVPLGAFRMGNAGRNVLDGPGFVGVNFALLKRVRVAEGHSLQFRWEVFNVANHANLLLPNNNVNAAQGGTITEASAPRSMQLGLKYIF